VRRLLTIAGGIGFVLVVIGVGSFGFRAARDQIASDRIGAGAPQAAPSGDEAKYHELAERLLTFGYSPTGPQSVTLLPAALPTDPAVTVPSVNGARLIGSAVRTRGTDRSADIVLDAPGDPQQVAAAYEQGFKDQGWTAPPGDAGISVAGGGFQASVPPVYRMLCKGENGAYLSVSVSGRSGQANDVRISVQPSIPAGGGSPCMAQRSRSPGGGNHLPVLRPPDGVTLAPGGGGGGSYMGFGGPGGGINRQSSEAGATSALGAGELEAAFAKQLAAAGWTRLAGRDDGALAWSTWTSNEAGWSGSLIINDTGTKDQRTLLLRAEGPAN
jgi:hypothetical protein